MYYWVALNLLSSDFTGRENSQFTNQRKELPLGRDKLINKARMVSELPSP